GTSIALSPDWRRVASVTADNRLQIRDAQTGQVILTLSGHTIPVRIAAFSTDGKRLASGGGGRQFPDGTVRVGPEDRGEVKVWDAQTGENLRTFPSATGRVPAVVFSPDGTRLAAASLAPPRASGEVKVWDVQTGQELVALKGEKARTAALAYSPDG